MATIDDVKAAYLAIYRKAISDAEATATAAAINNGTTSLDKTIQSYIAANIETTQPAISILAYVDGVVPTSAKITELATGFEVSQYNYYRDVLKVGAAQLAIAPYEATGRAVAQTDPAFKTNFGSGSDADFINTNYIKIMGEAPSAGAFANLQAQITYFTKLFTGATGVTDPALEARGAVLGQILGYAHTDPAFTAKAVIDDQVATFLTGAAKGSTTGYGAPLPAAANPGTVGVSIALTAGNDAVSANAADPAFRSTGNNDTATGPLNNGDNINLGAGSDTVVGSLAADISLDSTKGAGNFAVLSGVEILKIDGNGHTFDATGMTGVTNVGSFNSGTLFTNLPGAQNLLYSIDTDGGTTRFGFGTTAVADKADITLIKNVSNVTVGDSGAPATGQLGATAVTLHVQGNSTAGLFLDDTKTLTIDGAGNTAFTIGGAGGGANAALLNSIDASASTGKVAITWNDEQANATIKLSAQDDIFSTNASTAKLVTVTTGTGLDTVAASAAPTNVSFNADGSLKTGLVITDFTKGSDHLNLTAIAGGDVTNTLNVATLAAVNGAATVQAAYSAVLGDAALAAGKYALFQYGADSYVAFSDGVAGITAGDGIIKVTGISGLSHSASGDVITA